jgi:hypothetical protein
MLLKPRKIAKDPAFSYNIGENCNGCQVLWDSQDGTLCTDPSAPVYKWNNTERDLPDKRSFYASQIAVLAMKVNRHLERQAESCVLRRKAA